MSTVKSRPSQNLPEVIAVPRRDLALEFVNTLAWRGSSPTESLHDFGDVISWLAANKALQTSASDHLHKWFAAHPARAADISREAIELRETIHRLLKSAASSSVPAREDLRDLNLALGDAAPRVSLERTEGVSDGVSKPRLPPQASSHRYCGRRPISSSARIRRECGNALMIVVCGYFSTIAKMARADGAQCKRVAIAPRRIATTCGKRVSDFS